MVTSNSKCVGAFSAGIANILYLDKILDATIVHVPKKTRKRIRYDAVAGWGMKPSAALARGFASENNIPYIALEDGFLRSLGLGVHGHFEHSFIADDIGVYYDATRPSALENLIMSVNEDAENLQRASCAIKRLQEYRLSKYNAAPDYPVPRSGTGTAVLVVDQTFGDLSVQLGMGSAQTFTLMLESAVNNHPNAEILVKVHPDVIAGKKQGYLLEAAKQFDCTLISDDVNPWAFFDIVSDVYVVTSHLGFEALIAGKKVHCFGMPYYAGWGLTQDYQMCERRKVNRSLTQLFYAVYVQYCRYINPYTGTRCGLEETIELLALQKRHLERYRGRWLAYKVEGAERQVLKTVLGFGATIKFVRSISPFHSHQSANHAAIRGCFLGSDQSTKIMEGGSIDALRLLPGPLCTAKLGRTLSRPLSVVIEPRTITDKEAVNSLEHKLNTTLFSSTLLQQAETIRHRLLALSDDESIASLYMFSRRVNQPVVLVVGDKADSDVVDKMLKGARESYPDAYLIFCDKTAEVYSHSNPFGVMPSPSKDSDFVIPPYLIDAIIAVASAVYTYEDYAGFLALLRGVKVVTFGRPFYAGWGLTDDKESCDNRQKVLALNELVAGVFILHPVYMDPETGDIIDVETALTLLEGLFSYPYGLSFRSRCKRITRFIYLNV